MACKLQHVGLFELYAYSRPTFGIDKVNKTQIMYIQSHRPIYWAFKITTVIWRVLILTFFSILICLSAIFRVTDEHKIIIKYLTDYFEFDRMAIAKESAMCATYRWICRRANCCDVSLVTVNRKMRRVAGNKRKINDNYRSRSYRFVERQLKRTLIINLLQRLQRLGSTILVRSLLN